MSTLRVPLRLTIGLAGATVVAIGALATRMALTGTPRYGFLAWNLFLAWLPYLAAVAATLVAGTGRRGVLPLGTLWLLFWPNAPYIVTDVVHLRRPGVTVTWVEVTLIALFAATGLALGLASLVLMQRVVAARYGSTAGVALADASGRSAVDPAAEFRIVRKTDLVAGEFEQVGIDDAQARLAAGLCHHARNEVLTEDVNGFAVAD